MRFSDRWQHRFDIATTVAGAALHRAGAVRLHATGDGWVANVRDDGRIRDCHVDEERAGCTCMQRATDGPCAHLWATLLAIDDAAR